MLTRAISIAMLCALSCALASCDGLSWGREADEPAAADDLTPAHVAGTVGEYALLTGGGDLPVRGFGLVVGLGAKGSDEIPPRLRAYLLKYLAKQELGWWRRGTQELTPERFLRDPDTSAVELYAMIPPGAPKGTKFDVYVRTLPRSQTMSLDGGILMPSDLVISRGPLTDPDAQLDIWAKAAGEVFVNPFAEADADTARLRVGRILGGGTVRQARPLLLQLRRPDYQRADRIQKAINDRFRGRERIADAKDASVIQLTIPDAWRSDYRHFLDLVMHLPVGGRPGGWEAEARRVAVAMEMPAADYEQLALVWESMGRQVVPTLRTFYASRNPYVAYYAARTGLRLADTAAVEVIARFARSEKSPLQIPAIEELGRHDRYVPAVSALHDLLDDESELVRLKAYESLVALGDTSRVERVTLSDETQLHLVRTSANYAIYARQSMTPRIVLFGRGMPVLRPMFYSAPDELVVASLRASDEKMLVFRKVPRTGRFSDEFRVEPRVAALVETLGSTPQRELDGQIKGLGLTYSQLVGVLHGMCREGDIPARFVLQDMPGVRKIYEGAATVGRPDTPQ